MRDHIFISYRRDDTRGSSGRIYDWLRIGFGRERVFRDVHSIRVGKWRDKINDAAAWKQLFITGTQGEDFKSVNDRVRAIRAI